MPAHKPSFGFGAFVKLLSLNVNPQFGVVRSRLRPTGNGRDFHDSFRHRLRRLLLDGESEAAVHASLALIKQKPERLSAETGLQRLIAWREQYPGLVSRGTPVVIDSPSGYYSVKYQPDFCVLVAGQRLPVVVYNNKQPRPDRRMTYAALWHVRTAYSTAGLDVSDPSVLDLPTGQFLRVSEEPGVRLLAENLLQAIDLLFERAMGERRPPSAPGPTPPAPSPP